MFTTSERKIHQPAAGPTLTEGKDRIVVLGGGPAGLAAAYRLCQQGKKPIVLERSPFPGGLMRGIVKGDFSVDLGRKEIYERIPEVVALWEELVGDDLIPYPHRIGLLYDGNLIEYSGSFRGPLRGIPASLLSKSCFDFVKSRMRNLLGSAPRNYEERWHQAWGATLTRVLTQGFSEKFYGTRWKDLPVNFTLRKSDLEEKSVGCLAGFRSLGKQLVSPDPTERQWRHPRFGTQQLVDRLVGKIQELGGSIRLQARVSGLETSGNRVTQVVLETAAGTEHIPVSQVISSVPLAILSSLLGKDEAITATADRNRSRETILLYLFLDAPTRMKHAWLNVACPKLKIGRITNYEAFGGGMVPTGKGCLAVTVFVHPGDEMIDHSNEAIEELIISEISSTGLIAPETISDRLLIRLPGAEASNEYQTWETDSLVALRTSLRRYENVYDVNRAGIDIALYAGIKAAEALAAGSRASFDIEAAPERVPV